MNVFDLMAKISLDKGDYDNGMKEASETGQSTASKIGSTMKTAGKVVTATMTAVGTAVGTATKKTYDGMKATAEYGDVIDKTSQKLGISTKTYQEYDYIMNLAGTSMQDMTTGMKTLTNQLDSAISGGTDATENFKKLGISMDDLKKMSREDLFKVTIERLQQMEDTTERASLANDLFGKSGQNLTPLFNMSNEETSKLIKNLNDMGAVMSDDSVKASANFKDALTTLDVAVQGLKNGAMSKLLPATTDIINGLTSLFSGDSSGMGKVKKGVQDLSNKLMEELPKLMEFGSSILSTIADAIMSNLPVLMDSATQIVLQLSNQLISNLPDIAKTGLEIIVSLAEGIASNLPEMIPTIVDVILEIVDTLIDNADLLIDGAVALMIGLSDGFVKAFPKIIEKIPLLIAKLVNAISNNLPAVIKGAGAIILAIAQGLFVALPQLLRQIPQLIIQIANAFGIKAIDGFNGVGANIIRGIWNGLASGWNWLMDKVSDLAGSLIKTAKNALGIHSPSKAFAQIGEYCAEGFDEGMDDLMDADSLSKNIKSGLQSVQGSLGNISITGSSIQGLADQNVSVNITLAGDADGIFRVVRQESKKFYQSTGVQAFA